MAIPSHGSSLPSAICGASKVARSSSPAVASSAARSGSWRPRTKRSKKLAQADAGRLLEHRLHLFRVRHAPGAVVGPQLAQNVFQAVGALGAAADLEVHRQRHQAALEVVRDGAVGVELGRLIQLDPGVERRLLEAVLGAAGGVGQAQLILGQLLHVAGHRHQPGDAQGVAVVVAGQALHHPQAAGVLLGVVAERRQPFGEDALAVPHVEELVRQELEQIEIVVLRRHGVRRVEIGRRAAVLEAAVGAGRQHQHEGVVVVRRAAEAAGVGVDDGRQVGGQLLGAGDAAGVEAAPHHQASGRTVGAQLVHVDLAHVHRAVEELVEVGGAMTAVAGGRQADVHCPVAPLGRPQRDLVRALAQGVDIEVDGRPVEERVAVVDVAGADGQLVAVDAIADHHLGGAGVIDPPALLADLGRRQGAAVRPLGPQIADEPGVVAHQVAARAPGGHRHFDAVAQSCSVGDAQLDLAMMGFGIGNRDRVVESRGGHSRRRITDPAG